MRSEGASDSAAASGSASIKFEDEQRRERIVYIKAMLPFIHDDARKAELHGELATLERREYESRM